MLDEDLLLVVQVLPDPLTHRDGRALELEESERDAVDVEHHVRPLGVGLAVAAGHGDFLGDRAEREGNRNVEESLLRAFLKKQGLEAGLVTRALHVLEKAAGDTTKSLYDRNRAVYELLRYGVKVKAEVGEHTETVWLIDWKRPDRNHFAIAEEVTVAGNDAKAYTKRPDVVLYVNGR